MRLSEFAVEDLNCKNTEVFWFAHNTKMMAFLVEG